MLMKEEIIEFDAVPFEKATASALEEAVMHGIESHRKEIDAIATDKDEATFENTIAALDRSGEELNKAVQTLSNLEAAVGSEELMNAMAAITPLYSAHSTDVLLNKGLWERIKYVYDHQDERTDLPPEDLRLLSETYRSFSESGANLEGEAREKFRSINSRLSDLSVKFSQNVTNEMKSKDRRLWLTDDDTEGLPESIKTAARMAAAEALEEEGKEDDNDSYLVTIFMPSYVPFIKYSSRRDLREKLYRLYNSRNNHSAYDNTEIVREIANLRLELANLMGKPDFASYHLQGTMAATPGKVMELLENLRANYTAPMEKELEEIEEFAKQTEGDSFRLMPWDYSYWANKLKESHYAFNDEDLKPYFELTNTIRGVFGLAERLYGYSFHERNDIPVYHPDVRVFEVKDEDGSTLGVLYADFYYREGKSPGAWMTEYRTERKDDNGHRILPLVSIVMNFSKPVGNQPVLLTPAEVETFLHEFGHALHGISAQAKYESLSGTNVYHDFVELFSQFNENYLTEKQFLDGFACHYKTGDKIPGNLVDKFVKSRRFGAAYSCMRQLGFGFLDMAYHTISEPLPASMDIAEFERKAQESVKCFDAVDGCMTSPSFGHIFSGGYAAGYYGYKWSEVLDADAFAAFQQNGIFNHDTALRFKKMLQSGGTVDPMKLYVEFRGQEPSTEALLRRDGIK